MPGLTGTTSEFYLINKGKKSSPSVQEDQTTGILVHKTMADEIISSIPMPGGFEFGKLPKIKKSANTLLDRAKLLYIYYLLQSAQSVQLNVLNQWMNWANFSISGIGKVMFSTNPLFYISEAKRLAALSSKGGESRKEPWEDLQLWDRESGLNISALAAAFLVGKAGNSFKAFPYVPLMIASVDSMSVEATNKSQFTFDFSDYFPAEFQFLAMSIQGGRFMNAAAEVLSFLVKAPFYPVEAIAGKAGEGLVKSVGEAVKRIVRDPAQIFTVRGPRLWRGSSEPNYSISVTVRIPYVLGFDADSQTDLVPPVALLDPSSRSQYSEVIQQAIYRTIILPFRALLKYQLYGAYQGFLLYIARPGSVGVSGAFTNLAELFEPKTSGFSNSGLLLYGIPSSPITVDLQTNDTAGYAPQSFKISIQGSQAWYAYLPDLSQMASALASEEARKQYEADLMKLQKEAQAPEKVEEEKPKQGEQEYPDLSGVNKVQTGEIGKAK